MPPDDERDDLGITLKSATSNAPARDRLVVEPDPISLPKVRLPKVIHVEDLAPSRQPLVALRRRPSKATAPVLRLGSAPDCDVVLEHPSVAPVHAELRNTTRGPMVVDVSHGGAGLVVNGRFVDEALLTSGDRVGVGPATFLVDGRNLVPERRTMEGPELHAEGISIAADGRVILQDTWLSIRPGELVAVIGESGAGKSTLLKALAGVHEPATGRVRVDADPIAARRTEVGYVPQDEIVHPLLTVREALRYAAELRLPQGTPNDARDEAVQRVISEVGLSAHADTRIGSLSGGQRKRVGVAVELVSWPRLLFLDEPTTGLDPGLERRMMQLFRSLADHGRAVVLVTHATRSLGLCDRIVVMGRGGLVAFCGTPASARAFFGVGDVDEIYDALDRTGAVAWHQRFRAAPEAAAWGRGHAPTRTARVGRPGATSFVPQAATLIRRYARLFSRDRRTLTTIALQVPILALATALLFDRGIFERPGAGAEMHAGESAQLIFLVVTIALWFGAIVAAREIVKERTVVGRELAVGVRTSSYVASKLVVLFAIAGLQTAALVAVVFALRPLGDSGGSVATILTLMLLTSFVGVGLGLLVSALARSEDQATSFIPLLLVPQLLLGGAIVPLEQTPQPMKAIGLLIAAQWAFAGSGTAIDMNTRIAEDPVFSTASRYGPDFFDLPPAGAGLILLAFTAASVLVVGRRVRNTAA